MTAFRRWLITAGLVLAAAASAQGVQAGPARYQPASDLEGPYADVPPPAVLPPAPPVPAYGPPPAYGPGPSEYGAGYGQPLLPPTEVYAVLRENGFSPLGAPRLRGVFYSISAIDRRGDDGRLVIDARNGRIVRFVPAYRLGGYGDGYYRGQPGPYAPLEPMTRLDASPPRPPAAVPRMASRMPPAIPVPRAAPPRSTEEKPLAEKRPVEKPAPAQQSAAVQVKPAEVPSAAPPAVTGAEAKPAVPAIQPTQPMPQVQGLE